MRTQITCPNCGTPYVAEVHQVIDVGRNPELKRRLLNGQLNVAVCPNCGAGGQLSTAMVYHDPENELFMIYVPQELNLNQVQREEYIGQLTREVMDNTPPEQRRAYMLQPQVVLTLQTFMENVLETEGITKEMIARQRKQAELLNTLAGADADVADHLLKERAGEIDETFFAMLRSYIDAASQMNDNQRLLPLLNLQARLMTETAVGQQIEKRQVALHKMNQDAKQAGGLTPQVLLRHVLRNQEDEATVDMLVQVGMGALTYEFFSGLTAEIEKQRLAGKKEAAARLTDLRDRLLRVQEEMRNQSQQILQHARNTLEKIITAEDKRAALEANLEELDDAFMYVLSAEIDQAEQAGKTDRLQALEEVQELLLEEIEDQSPPEIQLLNGLVRAESREERVALLDASEHLVSEDLLKVVDALQDQVKASGQEELNGRLANVKQLIAERLASVR